MRTKLELDDETEEQLETKVCAFLNRWAQHDLIPQFEKVLTQCRQELLPELRQRLQAIRDAAGVETALVTTVLPVQKRSSVETEMALRSTIWNDTKLRRIEDETMAGLAYDCSEVLKKEFGNDRNSFLAYWAALRRKETL